MKLLGIIDEERGKFLVQEDSRVFIKENLSKDEFSNYELLKNRDTFIGNKDKHGEGVFNFRYGPVSAGVAEAGVFNIRTYGERILSLNIDPSYKKRNIEKLMINKTPDEAIKLAESVCGNFLVSHSTAFATAIENIYKAEINKQVKRLRVIALELERIYNHIHVIARLSKGAAQNVLTSHLEWLFEESLRINKAFSGNRFLKGFNKVGGVNFSEFENLEHIKERISNVQNKFKELYSHSLESWNFIDRIYKTALLKKERAVEIGLTGPSLRASGAEEDLRKYDEIYDNLAIATRTDSDALARMETRAYEIINSCDIINSQINSLERTGLNSNIEQKDGCDIGFAESPSGTVAYYAEIKNGTLQSVYISTPSVFGYQAFADSIVGYIFTDFSFALDSYGINFADCAR